MKRVITEKAGLIPRDVCARPHTFELVSVRPPRRGEQDTLVTKTYNTMTTTRFVPTCLIECNADMGLILICRFTQFWL